MCGCSGGDANYKGVDVLNGNGCGQPSSSNGLILYFRPPATAG